MAEAGRSAGLMENNMTLNTEDLAGVAARFVGSILCLRTRKLDSTFLR